MGRITVIGSLNMDVVVTTREIPRIGETVLGESLAYVCGGKGGNQAAAAARMGAEVAMVGCVGDDVFGKKLKQELVKGGINTDCVQEVPDSESGVAVITVKDGDNSIIVVPGTNASVTVPYTQSCLDVLERADMILLQLEIPMETVEYVIEYAKEKKIQVMLNPAPAQPLKKELFSGITYFIVNETESEYYTGLRIEEQRDVEQSIFKLKEMGVKSPVITLGSKGVVFEEDGRVQHMAARKVEAVDTTAAGDSFAAALASKLTEGASLYQAAEFATAVSSIVVTREGAQTSIPVLEEVMELLEGNGMICLEPKAEG